MRHNTLIAATGLLLTLTGCGDMAYRGVGPTVRTFADKPTVGDYYVGMNMRFAVLEPEDQRRLGAEREAQLASGKTPQQILKAEVEAEKKIETPLDTPSSVPGPEIPQ